MAVDIASEEGPDEVHGGCGNRATAKAEEEAGDDNQDVLSPVLDRRRADPGEPVRLDRAVQ